MLNERFTLWTNADGLPVEKTLAEMTGGEVMQAIRWLSTEKDRLGRACAEDELIAEKIERGEPVPEGYDLLGGAARLRACGEADTKLADLLQRLRGSMPQWRRHPGLKLTAAVQRFWPR